METKIILVPIQLDAYLASGNDQQVGPHADFSGLPYLGPDGDVKSDHPNISESILSKPFGKCWRTSIRDIIAPRATI